MEGGFQFLFQPSSSFSVGLPGSADLMLMYSASLCWLEGICLLGGGGVISSQKAQSTEYLSESVSVSFSPLLLWD